MEKVKWLLKELIGAIFTVFLRTENKLASVLWLVKMEIFMKVMLLNVCLKVLANCSAKIIVFTKESSMLGRSMGKEKKRWLTWVSTKALMLKECVMGKECLNGIMVINTPAIFIMIRYMGRGNCCTLIWGLMKEIFKIICSTVKGSLPFWMVVIMKESIRRMLRMGTECLIGLMGRSMKASSKIINR
jgi:hypothetical protein